MTNREIVNGIVAQRVATGSVSWEFLIEQALDEATKRGALQMRERAAQLFADKAYSNNYFTFAADQIRALPLIEGEK